MIAHSKFARAPHKPPDSPQCFRARADDETRAEFARLRDGHSHSGVFERAGRIAALVFEF